MIDGGIFEPEKDVGKTQFQQELSRWFESRGIIADLRSHLRHLMIRALQSAQIGAKQTNGSSPKAQALNLMVAEYLFRRRCHYTLSVFTSEVPTLANFNLDAGPQGRRTSGQGKKHPSKSYFQECEVEEIFNALGLPPSLEELALLKGSYLEKGNEDSLMELFLRMAVEVATKVQIHQDLESHAHVEGERLLSKKWSSKIVDVLMSEKMAPSQISAMEETIFRITETETRRAVEEQRRAQMQMLSEREKRIQEHLGKHEDEIFYRLMEAEKELKTRKDLIDEELNERERHLTKMAVEWNNKHEEILRLSKKFHKVESENRTFKKKLKELEEENKSLRTERETQTRTIHELRGELNSLINKLKEVTDSNAILSERIQALINRESKEVCVRQDGANQASARTSVDIPLLWPKSISLDADGSPVNCHQLEELRKAEEKTTFENESPPQPAHQQRNIIQQPKSIPGEPVINSETSEDEDVSLSSSFGDIIHGVQKKLQFLENESNRLNQNYLEYKLKCIPVDSDSESSKDSTAESQSIIRNDVRAKESRFCQTNADDIVIKIQRLRETNSGRSDFEGGETKKSDVSPVKFVTRTPTKRQLQNRDFFLERRHLVQLLEKQRAEELQARRSTAESSTSSSGEEITSSEKLSRESPQVKSISFSRPTSARSDGNPEIRNKPSPESARKASAQSSNPIPKSDADCLALLEKARIKSPLASSRKPLRQQILMSESEKEEEGRADNFPKSVFASPPSTTSEKVGKKSGSERFW